MHTKLLCNVFNHGFNTQTHFEWSNENFVYISFSFHFAGLIVTGGQGAATSIETLQVDVDATCTIPPFPEPGNLSSSHSPPKGDVATPSLSLKTAVNWSPAEGETPRSLASLGGVAKMIGLTMQH